ncbi:hypothetical protein LJY25_13530 [Hymenobacter sp. BT175]|uniref:hypothetical protein n=1 Tax=Hymenobacter translucens TaxID=2886507 RepID=UPI001D0E1A53|nr:hypothetical protein [Hymenobacter translucens]MCC2547471.1 hypothetical protein [Hymenobacter translucens]
MTTRLLAAIENLYEVFARYPGNANMDGSPIYDDLAEWNAALFAKPLRELTDQDLTFFTGSVLLTWGGKDDLKHFLPRILELTAYYNEPYDFWLLFERLTDIDWLGGPELERAAIVEYARALWESLLQDESDKAEWSFMEYFSTLAHFFPDFTELLATWENAPGRGPVKHLAGFVFNENQNVFDKGFIKGFYNQKEHAAELQAWLLSLGVRQRLEAAYFTYERQKLAGTISWAEKILTDYHRLAELKSELPGTPQ